MARSGVLNVYIEDTSPRTDWIFRLMLEELLGLEVNFVAEPVSGQPLLNYSGRDIEGAVRIMPYGLLNESGVRPKDIRAQEHKAVPVFFTTEGGDLPFDPFSMSFYLVSRYEEYLPFEADEHGRFPHTQSLAFKENFLHLAVVNRCAAWIGELLEETFQGIKCSAPGYQFLPTVDVDLAYAHLGKGLVRTCGAFAKLLLRGNVKEIRQRICTMQGKRKDPFDNFDMLVELFSGHEPDPVFFILTGDPGPYDRNLSLKNKSFANLVKRLSDEVGTAIHPSYGAGNDFKRIKMEMDRIEAVTGRKITSSRQHFVRMTFPETYEALIRAGISEDYSMGYASSSGFRAGIASPFNFYNLKKESVRPLKIYPFMFMDTSMSDYMHLEADEYFQAVHPLIEEVKKFGGTLSGIWHNYDLSDDKARHEALYKIFDKAKSE